MTFPWFLKNAAVSALVVTFCFLSFSVAGWTQTGPMLCGANGPETLKPYGDINNNFMTDLKVVGECDVTTDPGKMGPLVYAFHNVNIVNNGQLIFHDDYDIDFYAESILVENGGKLTAVSTQAGYLPHVSQQAGVLPFTKRLTIHLWGAPNDPGIVCASDLGPNNAPCGIPNTPMPPYNKGLWDANPIMAMDLMQNPPPPPPSPKNQPCVGVAAPYIAFRDCFYRYEIQDAQDIQAGRPAYFGHKVLAVSYGGTLQLFGAKGASYLMNGQKCMPDMPGTECNPAFTGTSWVRLVQVIDATHIKVSRAIDWQHNDNIVVTPTDYLPSHAEQVAVDSVAEDGVTITLQSPGLVYNHNASTFPFPKTMPSYVGPQDDPNTPDITRAVDTRAAVALLTRNIQVVSQGIVPSDDFTEAKGNFYGGHTIVRQGFASYQVQGVEFYRLGQGGAKGRYPVHFHMLRKVAQPIPTGDDPTPEPLNYLKDCSIWDSMTRWVTIHATEGMYVARNVGYKSIGHGYYFEDATETNNKLYGNIGIFARAAIQDKVHNPRQVPGILADNSPRDPNLHDNDYMPFRSDYNHPTVFWITNGWNDFQYNFAAGAATCGACYWWLPAADSGPSQYQTWDSYASEGIVTDGNTNYARAGLVPLKNFVGNSCVAAMSSFQMNGQTAECLGVQGNGSLNLSAVPSSAPPGPPQNNLPNQPYQVYYPVVGELHNPTLCLLPLIGQTACAANMAGQGALACDGGDTMKACTVTHLDHYTTSFNFAQTNFAAVWLRKGWDLFTNGAVTDIQSGGLNFITGGGYTRSDVAVGEWLLARNTVLIGHTQPPAQNPYASEVGPFNSTSGLGCDNTSQQATDHCEYADGGMSFNLPVFPGQKLVNIYDGPSQQVDNAYFNINETPISDCTVSNGTCLTSKVPLAWNLGLLQDNTSSPTKCYLPNAAIGWKQPNGFYYPPAFHSKNLWFSNVDIRHFVIEPLFEPITPDEYDPFQQNQTAVVDRYCTYSSDMFSASFNHIDRQTVLNDDDGTLTGLIGSEGGQNRATISINEDDFFLAPLTTPECLSDIDVKPPLPLPASLPYTATTSPYEWLSTAMIADCAIAQNTGAQQCFTPSDMFLHWAQPCGNSDCRGVPLYREYLTNDEFTNNTRPQIRMMGQGNGQRSTLSLNRAAYYIDTTQNCLSQGGCPKCITIDPKDPTMCMTYDGSPWDPSVFLGGHTYYVYLLYATATTKQHYDLYVGVGAQQGELNVTSIWLDPSTYALNPPTDTSFIKPDYSKLSTSGILSVDVDLTGQGTQFTNAKKQFCRPQSYCSVKSDGSCGCNPDNPNCVADSDCTWGPNDIDCPVDPANANVTHCFGFSFTMPEGFKAPATPMPPPSDLFIKFTDAPGGYFDKGNVIFAQGQSISPSDACVYNPVPTQQ